MRTWSWNKHLNCGLCLESIQSNSINNKLKHFNEKLAKIAMLVQLRVT